MVKLIHEFVHTVNTVSPKFIRKDPLDNKSALVHIMACRLFGAIPVSKSILDNLVY